ncbi:MULTISPECIES: transporter substrate-binding domain-containing protein [Moraxella]|uniref:Cyclohexadienyl dehydratase n=1 Tax=Moraxella catarrhalis TaxID=480 RepID=A0A7Z0UZ38_MORCA|nr:transporter substrate-binding domain-containing protein [Moraxella catarrhalis]OAV01204.1 Cyclohexadienyl dehydratase [Moraxella catarrhalis]STY81535.1 Cyclohexadienyl dehydratase precursor [Moraxella catarrhalis]
MLGRKTLSIFSLIGLLTSQSVMAMTSSAEKNSDTLERVMNTKQLRVCSPGDYKPFSFDNGGKFEGIDNDLIDLLAKSMDAKVLIIKTTWSNLMTDFTSGKCDIGVGGISITLPRQQKALFTQPYFTNGKTPLVRCEDVAKYQTIDAINQSHVRIVANPGGSNENFARTVLTNAKLTMHPENLTIFDEVAAGHADVFVTEAAEAIVKTHEYKGVLCGVNPDKPLKPAQNGWLIPNDDFRFKAYVDQFLYLEKLSGNLDHVINRWLPRQ